MEKPILGWLQIYKKPKKNVKLFQNDIELLSIIPFGIEPVDEIISVSHRFQNLHPNNNNWKDVHSESDDSIVKPNPLSRYNQAQTKWNHNFNLISYQHNSKWFNLVIHWHIQFAWITKRYMVLFQNWFSSVYYSDIALSIYYCLDEHLHITCFGMNLKYEKAIPISHSRMRNFNSIAWHNIASRSKNRIINEQISIGQNNYQSLFNGDRSW